MKKSLPKAKIAKKSTNKSNKIKVKDKELLDIEDEGDENAVEPELDPEVLKVLNKAPKKPKAIVDAGDYVSELERDDLSLGEDL